MNAQQRRRVVMALGALWSAALLHCNAECLRHSDCATGYVCWAGLCTVDRATDAGSGGSSLDLRGAARERFDEQNTETTPSGQGGTEPTLPTPDLDGGASDSGSQTL